VHNVSQWPNLNHLGEPLGGAEGLLEAVSFNKAMESKGGGRVANARWERVPHSGGCNTKTTGDKDSANCEHGEQTTGRCLQSAAENVWGCGFFLHPLLDKC